MENLAKQADVLFLQETHGDVHHMATLLPRLASKFFVHSSPCENLAAGGVITMIAKKWAGDQCEIGSEALCRGRVVRTVVRCGGKAVALWNVHNFGIGGPDRQTIGERLRADTRAARGSPLDSVVILGGDMNFASDDGAGGRAAGPRDGQRFWEGALASCTGIAPTAATHYFATENRYTAIDRVYTSLPNWALVNLHVAARVSDDPIVLF